MSYMRFGLMILTSTVVMFGLMYLNTFAFEHVFFSETRAYMAVVMGAVMAIVMLAFMASMYPSKKVNAAIFLGAIVVFAVALTLVRSQITVQDRSFMSAMIPHHSIAIMTSGRAEISDARVRKLADEIIDAQNREVAEMRYLIADIGHDGDRLEVYEDPPASVGTVEDALNNTLLAKLDPAPMTRDEAVQATGDLRCGFRRTAYEDPILWTSQDGSAAVMKLNGVIVALQGEGSQAANSFTAPGVEMTVRALDDADWRADNALIFALDAGPRVGYRGFYRCDG